MLQFDEEDKKVVGSTTPIKGLDPKPDYKINRYLFLAIIIVFAIVLFLCLSEFFTAFLGAVIFYVLLRKLMNKLLKRGWKKPAAAVFVSFISLLILLIPLFFVGMMLYNKGKYYVTHPDALVTSLQNIRTQIQHNYGISIISEEKIADVKNYATAFISRVLNESLGIFGDIIMLYFLLYFMLISVNRLEAAIVFFLPFKRSKIELFGRELVAQTFSNSVGVPAIALAQGTIGFIGYYIAGVNDPAFWALLTAFASILPVIGTAIIWVPVTLYVFVLKHTWQGFFLIGWGAIVLGLTDNVVRFLLARKMADVHPIITVLGVVMGVKYFGLAGLIFGPVLISYFLILLRIYYLEYQSASTANRKKKNDLIRFNLPFIGSKQNKKKAIPNATDRSKR